MLDPFVSPSIIGAVPAAGHLLVPAWLVTLLLWTLGGAVALVLLWLATSVVVFHWKMRHPIPLPKVPPMPCPSCGGTEHDYRRQGLWDGVPDPVTGGRAGGSFDYGICKACGSRWAQWDDAPPYVPPEDEWEREVAGPEAARAEHLRQWTEHHAGGGRPTSR
jgi:hypothetical protein